MEANERLRRIVWNGTLNLKLVLSEEAKAKMKFMYENGVRRELLGDNPPVITKIVSERYTLSRVKEGIVFRIKEKRLDR